MKCQGALSKKEIAQRVSDEMGFPMAASLRIVDSMFETLKEALIEGETLKIVRFGSFRPVKRMSRRGTDPSSGKIIEIPARRTVVFNPGRLLKTRVNSACSRS